MTRHRKLIEKLYMGICTIAEYQSIKDPETKRTRQTEVTVLENQPCRLSFKTVSSASEFDNAPTISQVTKLFIAPEIIIKAGSKITVTQDGRTTDYSHSGVPAVYSTHQEIALNLFDGWA